MSEQNNNSKDFVIVNDNELVKKLRNMYLENKQSEAERSISMNKEKKKRCVIS